MKNIKSEGASNTLFQHERPNVPKRSKFDISRIINLSGDPGMVIPFDCFPVLPGDVGSISLESVLDTLPLVQSSLTNYKVVFHYYYMKSRDLWKGFKTFITKGRTGNVELQIPRVDISAPINVSREERLVVSTSGEEKYLVGDFFPMAQHSLSSFLGVPPYISGLYSSTGDDSTFLSKAYLPYTFSPSGPGNATSGLLHKYLESIHVGFGNYSKVNALPFVMYQSIVKNNYVNQNLLQGNTALFPEEGDDDWLLPYTIEGGIANYISGRSKLDPSDKVNYDGIFSNDETDVDIRLLRYAMFDDDYFTTGLPWLQRGDVSKLNVDISSDVTFSSLNDGIVSLDGNLLLGSTDVTGDELRVNAGQAISFESHNSIYGEGFRDADKFLLKASATAIGSHGNEFVAPLYLKTGSIFNNLKAEVTNGSFSLTANMFRELLAMSVWQERNARVDGSYNRMIFQHWAQHPHSEEHLPIYLGGTAQYLQFSTIIQNSQTTSNSPLGSTAGYGNCSGSSDICNFKCDDYGYIMGIMIIKPNTSYQQGVERYLCCENTFTDFIQPEFECLSPQPILNKELFVSGDSNDDDLFCYQERNTSYKVRQNVNRGLFQCKPDKDILFGAFTQARWFENRPKFSYQFCVMSPENIRRDWLAYPVYPAFRAQIFSKVFITRNLSYSSQPNTFGF